MLSAALVCVAEPARAQPGDASGVRVANPAAVEMRAPASGPTGYFVSLFKMGDAVASSQPVKTFETSEARASAPGIVRIEFAGAFDGVADGDYFLVIRPSGPSSGAAAERVSAPFVIYGYGAANRRDAVVTVHAEPPEAERRQERFWTKVGIAVAAGLLALPILLP